MKKLITTLLAVFIVMTIAFGQVLEGIKLDNKQSILDDRAFFYFPLDAKIEKRGVDIMSADPNSRVETRIVCDKDNMRLVFFAQELFALADKDLLNTISKWDEKGQSKIKILTDKDSLLSILSTPTKFDSTKNTILVNSLIVKTQDNTLFKINAYINPNAFKLKDQYQELTENVFSTLTKGIRKNVRSARQEKLPIFGTDKSFLFNLPDDYCITVDQKYDFQVFKLYKYQGLSDTTWVKVLIYNGHHPSAVYRDYGLTEKEGQKITGNFLEKKVHWLFFDIRDKEMYVKEQMFHSDNIEKGLIVHIAMMSNQQKSLDDLTKIVESIKLTK